MTTKTINKYMSLVTSTETQGTRFIYRIGNQFEVEVMPVTCDLESKSSIMHTWKKYGYIKNPLPSYLAILTYYREKDGWHGRYNITVKPSDDGRRQVLNFDYLREATSENERELVAECIRLMVKATGYKPQKRYRDEDGQLTIPIDQIAAETLGEAENYYQDGGQYVHEGKAYTLHRYMDKTADGEFVEVAQFTSDDGYNLFVCPGRLGTFLPGVASDGMEIARI